ncbi:hypothetical protein TSO221_30495 [Azospirillum sp. TSO22-1]|nr:hypothetical protein TSO221_30495 [Azospirillum sp. TSO22-1]
MLDRMLSVLRGFLAFDIATFAEYAMESPTPSAATPLLIRGRYAVDDGKPFPWPARWLHAPSGIMDWTEGKDVAASDIDRFFRFDPSFRALRKNPVVEAYLARGVRSFIVAVHREDGRPACSLTLARKGGPFFTEEDRRALSALELADTLRLVLAAYRAKSAAFHMEIRDLFAQHARPEPVARIAVERLCEQFRWDYVAIFRVAHARARFELVQQHNASDKKLLVHEGYTQPFGAGVLGQVLRTGSPIRVEDTSKRSRHGYIQIADDARSCLCYPIVLDGCVEWILDCESSEVGAFQQPDEAELGILVGEAQKTIALWFEMRLNRALLENIDQGVVVVNQANRIMRLNSMAAQLLGASANDRAIKTIDPDESRARDEFRAREAPSIQGERLDRFGADEDAKAVLTTGHVAAKPLRLRGADGLERNVVASSRDAEDAFNRRIWRLTDPKAWDWVTALEYMRTTVQGVAQQTRGPLLLANALVSRAHGRVGDNPDLRGLLSKVRASLLKTDITYERLVDGLEVERRPLGAPVAADVKVALDAFMNELPEEDRKAVTVTLAEPIPAAWVDPSRLRFVLHSTIGYLLATRLPETVITVHLHGGPRHVAVELTTSVHCDDDFMPRSGAADPVAGARAGAQEATAHALSAVRRVIESNGGKLKITRRPGCLAIRFTLPAPPRGRTRTAGREPAHA